MIIDAEYQENDERRRGREERLQRGWETRHPDLVDMDKEEEIKRRKEAPDVLPPPFPWETKQ